MLRAGVADFDPDRARFIVGEPAIRRLASWSISWALAAAGMLIAIHSATAQTVPTNPPIEFNIPSQSLNTALSRYGDATGRQGLYDASLTRGRQSSAIRGALLPDEALRGLLSGTGLTVEFLDEATFVLLPAPLASSQRPSSPEDQRYFGVIQASLLDTFCRSRRVRPARYRFVAMFWIEPDGSIQRVQRIGSTGELDADQRVDATLRSVRVSEPPPAGFTQPVLMLIVPQASLVTGCERAPSRMAR